MQPYLFPYIGYFQLINSVDEFVIYDNIQYTKKGWINRNRIISNGQIKTITLPLKKDSDYLNVVERYVSPEWHKERVKVVNQIVSYYRKSEQFENVFPIIEKCLFSNKINLFDFIYDALIEINNYIGINTTIKISSQLDIDHNLKSKEKVIEICKNLNACTYINAIGGQKLYDKDEFASHQIDLKFISANPITYNQFNTDFVPWLSIIDVLMFNSKEKISEFLNNYTLI